MKFLILIIASLFLFQSCNKSSSNEIDTQKASNDLELRKKELELKEKELDLKEKEMKFNAKQKRIQQEEVKIFVKNWTTLQTNKAIDAYTNLYSADFQGIKKSKTGKTTYFNYSEWMNDRRKMYSTAKNLFISSYDIKVVSFNESSGNTKVQFTQYYSSDNYSDEGIKVMELSRDNTGDKNTTIQSAQSEGGVVKKDLITTLDKIM